MSTAAAEKYDALEFSPYEFTEFAIRLKGEPIDLSRRPWLQGIYTIPIRHFPGEEIMRRKLMLMFGRQSEKSTTLGNALISYSNLIPYLRSLYVTASNVQMREFSDERLRAVVQDSPVLMRLAGMTGPGVRHTQNVLTKRWRNFSKITLRSVYKNADRARGIPADLLCIDEIQDIHIDDLPVIEETLFHCELDDGPISVYSGTPKTFDNPIEEYWGRFSTQNEWLPRCSCGEWVLPDMRNIGERGLICHHCSRELNPVDGVAQWVTYGRQSAEWEGFHLCQPIVVYAYKNKPRVFNRLWQEILQKKKRYPRPRFMNEVMGRSYDAGTKPVTLDEVRRCCLSEYDCVYEPDRRIQSTKTWAGVDWGTGDASYTVLSIFRYDSKGRFSLVFAKRYEGEESDGDYAVRDIANWCRRFKVNRVGADWGFGFGSNAELRRILGAGQVVLFNHVGKQKEKIKVDKLGGKFTTHRSRVLQDVFTLIKKGPRSGGMAFFNWDEAETFMNDILCVSMELSETKGEIVYNHPRGVPDDFLHTVCYALLVSQFDVRRPDLHAPDPATDFTRSRRRKR